jgi:hypothetical protein
MVAERRVCALQKVRTALTGSIVAWKEREGKS